MKIILNGTSSSGKSTIMKLLPKNYKKVSLDGYFCKVTCDHEIKPHHRFYKNKYYTKKEFINIYYNTRWQYFKKETKNSKDFIIDTVETNPEFTTSALKKYLSIKNSKCVLLYTNLSNLIRNIEKRRNYDPRGLNVFDQFTILYTITDKENDAIGVVCLKDFIKDLKKVKYFFSSEKELITFAKKIFKRLNIKYLKMDKKYYIKPVDKYDIVLDSTNKTPEQLIKELNKKI